MKDLLFVCPVCGNKEARYIGIKNHQPYCRKCISFAGKSIEPPPRILKNVVIDLPYSLSSEQKALSKRIVDNFYRGIDTLVHAVCGAGKTELSYGVISRAVADGLTVGFALPRRDVVIELFYRLKDAFPHNKIVAVYGDHSSTLQGDIIILTTHQLYRYKAYFDLLVMDEIDAFPFKGNDVLIAMYKRSLRGHSLMMSATPSKEILKEFKEPGHDIVELRTRFHKRPIPVPSIKLLPSLIKEFFLISRLKEYQKKHLQCFVFVPLINMSITLFRFVSFFVKNGDFVNSKRERRGEIIEDFKKGKTSFLITTAVLERGVTIKSLQVIVFNSDSFIYDSSSLIQIAGRAGRKKEAPNGEVIFLSSKKTEFMEKAIDEIRFCNSFL